MLLEERDHVEGRQKRKRQLKAELQTILHLTSKTQARAFFVAINSYELPAPRSISLIQGCCCTSARLIRLEGSLTSNLDMRSRAPVGTQDGKVMFTFRILVHVSLWLSISNGGEPTKNSYKSTPKLQISTLASCGCCSSISGGK